MRDGCKVYDECCPVHGFCHGAEADELREGIQAIVDDDARLPFASGDDSPQSMVEETSRHYRKALEELLERVDARDSLARMEAQQDGRRRPARRRKAS